MGTEDNYIIQKCFNGEKEAFGFLVDKYKASVHAFIYARIGNFHGAQDLTQETFLKAFKDLCDLENNECFPEWLYSISSNLCENWIRHQSRKTDGEV